MPQPSPTLQCESPPFIVNEPEGGTFYGRYRGEPLAPCMHSTVIGYEELVEPAASRSSRSVHFGRERSRRRVGGGSGRRTRRVAPWNGDTTAAGENRRSGNPCATGSCRRQPAGAARSVDG